MNKKLVFIHLDAIPEDKIFRDLTDEQVYNITKSHPDLSLVYDNIEDFLDAFNCESGPGDLFWWGRLIDTSLFGD
jgi:hypothetical protein